MALLWKVVAHERCEVLSTWGTIDELLPFPDPAQIIHRLAVPVSIHVGEDFADPMATPPTAELLPQPQAPLLHLPMELMLLIADRLDLSSLYTLSDCCHQLRCYLRMRVHARLRRDLAPWANTPLTCLSSYFLTNPPGITMDLTPGQGQGDYLTVYDRMHAMGPTYVLVRSSCLSAPTLNRNAPNELIVRPKVPPWRRILKIHHFFPPGHRWILRNLTTREYVFAYVLTSEDEHGGGSDKPDATHPWGFTLATVIAVNTCWSDDPLGNSAGVEMHGKWAGNWFDIVEDRRLSEDMRGALWVDVSWQERSAMMRLFERNGWNRPRLGGLILNPLVPRSSTC